jgi:hypothetical protein
LALNRSPAAFLSSNSTVQRTSPHLLIDSPAPLANHEHACAVRSDFWGFSPSLLNSSYSSVTTLLNGTYPVTNTYVAAVLRAYNATSTDGQTAPTRSSSATPSSSGGGGGKKPGTSTALIILYCVVGVSVLPFRWCLGVGDEAGRLTETLISP